MADGWICAREGTVGSVRDGNCRGVCGEAWSLHNTGSRIAALPASPTISSVSILNANTTVRGVVVEQVPIPIQQPNHFDNPGRFATNSHFEFDLLGLERGTPNTQTPGDLARAINVDIGVTVEQSSVPINLIADGNGLGQFADLLGFSTPQKRLATWAGTPMYLETPPTHTVPEAGAGAIMLSIVIGSMLWKKPGESKIENL